MDFVFEPKAPFFIIDIDSTKEHGMEEIKLDGRCCLSCQNFLVNRTFRNKEGEETIVTEADKGVCSEGAYQGEKVPVLFSCSHYQRWNTIDLELIKNRKPSTVCSPNARTFLLTMPSWRKPRRSSYVRQTSDGAT